jgi:hypothetical protein
MKKLAVSLALSLFCGCTIDYTYEVTGDAKSALVTYTDADGSISQETSVSVPWSMNLNGSAGQYVSVSAQNNSASGSVVVEITKEGRSFKTAKSSGAYGVASASGKL